MQFNDPSIASQVSKLVMAGNAGGGVAPRGPLAPQPPESGPMNANPISAGIKAPAGPQAGPEAGMGPGNSFNSMMHIPGGSSHEVCHTDEGASDRVISYNIGTGSWQSASHQGRASHEDDSLRPQGPAPAGPELAGSSDVEFIPKHGASTVDKETRGDTRGSSEQDGATDSSPRHMDYSCDMGHCMGH
jgi:hypothetical protein